MGVLDSLFGGSKSTTDPSFVDPQQQAFLQQLFAGGLAQQQQLQPQFAQLGNISQQLGQQGQGFLGQLGQAGSQLGQFIGPGTTQEQIEGVTGVAQNFLSQNLNQIRGQSNLAGGFGGSRSQVAQGAAVGQAAAGLGGIIAQILGTDIQRRQDAASQQGQQQLFGAQAGLGGLGQLFGLAQGGLTSQFGGLGILQGLLGPATVLGGGGVGNTRGNIIGGLAQGFAAFNPGGGTTVNVGS